MAEQKKIKCVDARIESVDNGFIVHIKYDHYSIPAGKIFCNSLEGAFQIIKDRMTTNIILKD